MSVFTLNGYNNPIYSPKGLKEFLKKAYDIPSAKENTEYQKIYKRMLGNLSVFEKYFKETVLILKKELEGGENYRYSHQFIYMTTRTQAKKFKSDFDAILSLGKVTDNIIENICKVASEIKDSDIKKEYLKLISLLEGFQKKYPANKMAKQIFDDYLATEETKELLYHFLKRDKVSRGDEDVNLGTTLFGKKEIKLPTDKKLTNNNTLAMHKSGKFYYVKLDGKIFKYSDEGKKNRGNRARLFW